MKQQLKTIGIMTVMTIALFGCASNKIPDQVPLQTQVPAQTPPQNSNQEASKPPETTIVKIYVSNTNLEPGKDFSCTNVFPVERQIPKTTATGLASMQELLKGPTDAEKALGYTTNINPGVKVQKLTIENGVAKVDFNEQLQYQVGGSCRITAIIAQINHTLKQFPTVKKVVISINGQTEDILQP